MRLFVAVMNFILAEDKRIWYRKMQSLPSGMRARIESLILFLLSVWLKFIFFAPVVKLDNTEYTET